MRHVGKEASIEDALSRVVSYRAPEALLDLMQRWRIHQAPPLQSRARSASPSTSSKAGMLSSRSVRRHAAETAHCFAIKIPDLGTNRMIVRIDQVRARIGVSGEMKLPHALDRNAAQIFHRIETVVYRTHINVVDIE